MYILLSDLFIYYFINNIYKFIISFYFIRHISNIYIIFIYVTVLLNIYFQLNLILI